MSLLLKPFSHFSILKVCTSFCKKNIAKYETVSICRVFVEDKTLNIPLLLNMSKKIMANEVEMYLNFYGEK